MKKICEATIQRAILDYLAWYSLKNKVYWFRSGAGMVRTEAGGMFRSGKPGCPDITVCAPNAGGVGVFYGIEVKGPKGRQSATQKVAEAEIVAAGGRYELVRSLEDIKKIFPMGVKK